MLKRVLNLSFRSRRGDFGISLRFKRKEREIPRHAACLGMTVFEKFALQNAFPTSTSIARNQSNANTSHFEVVRIETNAGLVFQALVLPARNLLV